MRNATVDGPVSQGIKGFCSLAVNALENPKDSSRRATPTAPVKEVAGGRLLQLLRRHRLDVLENAVQPGRVCQVVQDPLKEFSLQVAALAYDPDFMPGSLDLPQPGIQPVTEPVAKKIER